MSAFFIFLRYFSSTLIFPLFNKQTLLEDGELKEKITVFCKKVNFSVSEIYKIDGSKRSSKANAYFAGFGKKNRICMTDTLINDFTNDEIVAVLSHEIGHYMKWHSIIELSSSILTQGINLYLLGLH